MQKSYSNPPLSDLKTQNDIDDEKLIKPFRDKKIAKRLWPDEMKKAINRIDNRKSTAKKAAKKAKVADLAKREAKLEAEVTELKARKAALPGSAVFHS